LTCFVSLASTSTAPSKSAARHQLKFSVVCAPPHPRIHFPYRLQDLRQREPNQGWKRNSIYGVMARLTKHRYTPIQAKNVERFGRKFGNFNPVPTRQPFSARPLHSLWPRIRTRSCVCANSVMSMQLTASLARSGRTCRPSTSSRQSSISLSSSTNLSAPEFWILAPPRSRPTQAWAFGECSRTSDSPTLNSTSRQEEYSPDKGRPLTEHGP